jgi:hypothetical protein
MAVCAWKSTNSPDGMGWIAEQESFEPLALDRVWSRFELRVKLPLDALVQCDAGRIYHPPNVHAYGHHVRGNSSKQRIYGDLWYQAPTLRFAKSAEQRADNFSDMGILAERPTTEIDAILRRLPDTFGNEQCDRRLRIRSVLGVARRGPANDQQHSRA